LGNGGLISGAFAEQSAHTGGIDLSAKGDMHGYSDDDARIPISTDNFSLLCDNAESLGLKWAASPTSVLDATGKMLYASSANTLAAISPGAEDTVLTMGGSSVPAWASGGLDPVFYSAVEWGKGAAQTRYFPLDAGDGNNVGSDADADQEQDEEVTIVMMHVVCIAAPSSDSKCTLRDDGADGTQITVTANTPGDYTTGTISNTIAAGSMVNWQMIAAGSGTFQITARALEGT